MTTLTAAAPSVSTGLAPVRAALAPAAGPAGLTPADFIRIIRHRLVLIIIVSIIFSGLTAAFTALMIKYYPKYSAQALILVESVRPINIMNPLQQETTTPEEVARLVLNQCVVVKSPDVLQRAIEDPDLRNTKWYEKAVEEEVDPTDYLYDTISASPIRDSNFFSVSAAWKIPSEVRTIVNTVVDKYQTEIERQQKIGLRQVDEQLTKELNRAQTLFEAKGKDIEDMRANEEVLLQGGEGPSERLLTLMALVTELEVETLGRKTMWESLQGARPEDLPITADLQALLDQDPAIAQLEGRRQNAQEMLRVAQERFGPNHRASKDARAAMESAEDRLTEERAVKIIKYQNEQIEQARRSYLEAVEQSGALREKLYEAKEEQRDQDKKYARYMRRLEERDLLKKEYESLMEQKNQIRAMISADKSVKIEVRSRAIEPKRRSSPQWHIWMPVGAVLGLMAAIGLALLLELADKTVRTPRDVQSVSVLGLIPTSDDDEIEIARVETASVDAPHSITAEAFRSLRANLFFSAPAEQQGVILVTSPSGGNGKTTVAANLAISIALSGRRVLLIDANFRRGGLPKIFPDMKEQGLSNLLIGQCRLPDVATPTLVPGLNVVGAGPIPPNPAELLGGSYLRDVIVEARSQYDQVLFDGPPVLLVSDALVLAGAVDGVLVVCQYRGTSRGALQRTLSQLEAINARVFGAVLNMVETRAGGYFRKVYREFYEYQEPSEEEPPRRHLDSHPGGGQLQPAPEPPSAGLADLHWEGDAESGVPHDAPAPQPGAPPDDTPIGDVGDLRIDDRIDLAAGLDETLGLDKGPPGEPDALEPPLPELDKEIDQLKDDPGLGQGLTVDDEFGLEDLDLGEDLPGPPGPPPDKNNPLQ